MPSGRIALAHLRHAGFFGLAELRHLRIGQHSGKNLFGLPLHFCTALHALALTPALPLSSALTHRAHRGHLHFSDFCHRCAERGFLL